MENIERKDTIKNYWFLYFLTILLAIAMKFFCRITDSDLLTWILAPTARWAGILGSIPFEYLAHQGYVNHFYRFLIAPSCSGIRFLTILFVMLIFSFLHRIRSTRAGYLWFVLSAALSYLATVFVNGIRIVLAVYLPIPLEKAGLLNGWLNPDRLHTLIGTAVYFSSLYIIYPAASCLCQSFFACAPGLETVNSRYGLKLLTPAFWYLSAVLALPLLGRAVRNDWEGFGGYAVLIIGVCTLVMIPAVVAGLLKRT